MRTIKTLTVAMIFLLISGNSFASAEDEFQKGVTYFKQQQYKNAINAFNKARKQGLKKPALYHNLGVSYFKTGQYTQAIKQFEYMRRFPNERMQAEYNIGLVAKKQKKPALARKQFLLVKAKAINKKLITLARIQLGELKPVDVSRDKPWSVYVNLGYGYDSNAASDPDTDTASHVSTSFKSYYVDGELTLLGDEDTGISINGSVSRTDASKSALLGYRKNSLGIQGKFQTSDWDNTIIYKAQDSSYGNVDYERINLYELSTKNYLRDDLRLRLRYRYYDIDSQNIIFDHLSGTKQRLRAELKLYGNESKTRVYVERETNDRTDSDTRSYSATRTTLHADYKYSLTDKLSLRGDISYRETHYPAHGISVGRDDERTRYGLKLSYEIDETWRVRAIYDHTENESSDAVNYSYTRNITSLELIADF